VLAGERLFVAGPADRVARRSGVLQSVSAGNGKRLREWALPDAPVYDGMAAAGGRLYLATRGGLLVCFGGP
jgi:hypothetical protein